MESYGIAEFDDVYKNSGNCICGLNWAACYEGLAAAVAYDPVDYVFLVAAPGALLTP